MSKLKRTLWVLMLLPLVVVTGCDSVIEVGLVTETATPMPFTPTPRMITEATLAPTLPLTSVEATPTSPPIPQPSSTPVPTSGPPTATPVPPTPTAEPEPTRIQFKPGTTSATVTGHIAQYGVERYVLRAFAGQIMEVLITSPNNDVLLSIWGADGTVLKRHVDGGAYWAAPLPSTQDYFINAVSVGQETTYELTVTISPLEPEPTRIQFEPGATSATVTGSIEQYGSRLYVLRALAGQTMEVVVTSPNGGVGLSIWGADGIPLKRYVDERAEWRGVLPATQDYFIQVVSVQATSYVLTVIISPLKPEPRRIQFAPGATSAVIEGSLEPGAPDRYVLRALRGQRMEVEVRVSPTATVEIAVAGQDGSFWSALGTLRIEELPATQDYIITLALPIPLTGAISYTMGVSIPPP